MVISEIYSSSIITKSNLPDSDYVINPYVGCSHSCIYCYARFMKRFTNHKEEWGTFVDAKINAPNLIPTDTTRYKGKLIFLSSVTDPYIPLERKYKLTRKIIEKLIPLEPNLGIQTKSDLVLRDVDLFKKFENCEVGLTITTLDDNLRKEVEPFSASVEKRINALKILKKSGIKTYVFIGPILPYLTDWKEIISKTRHFSDCFMFENLNISGSIWRSITGWIKRDHPKLVEKYMDIKDDGGLYWNGVRREIKEFCKSNSLDHRVYFDHGK